MLGGIMLDMGLSDEEMQLKQTARKLAEERLRAPTLEWEQSGIVDFPYLINEMTAVGLVGMVIPEEYGGGGASFLDFILVMEEMARVSYPAAYLLQATNSGPVKHIAALASAEVKSRVLSEVAAGKAICSIAITEPDAGSDLGAIRTTARQAADGEFRVNGRKLYVGGAGNSSFYVVYVRMSDDPGTKGLGCILIDADTDGLELGPNANMLGSRGIPRHELIFNDCRVPAANVLCGPGEFRRLISIFNGERIHNAAMALGTATGAYDHALEHARARVQFGQRLADFQGIRWKLADMAARLDTSRLLVQRVARLVDSGADVGYAASVAKLITCEAACEIVDSALQIEGAMGYHEGFVQNAYRNVRMTTIAAGSTEMMRNHLANLVVRG
jgi:alkylation response protein AidB-like acyl-CoA dehydrogenase